MFTSSPFKIGLWLALPSLFPLSVLDDGVQLPRRLHEDRVDGVLHSGRSLPGTR